MLLSSLGSASNFVVDVITCDDQAWRSVGDSVDETFHKSWSTLLAAPLIKLFDDFCCNRLNHRLPDHTGYLIKCAVLSSFLWGLLALVVVIPCHGFGVRYNNNRPVKRRRLLRRNIEGAMDSSQCGFEGNAARVTVRHVKFDVPAKLGIV